MSARKNTDLLNKKLTQKLNQKHNSSQDQNTLSIEFIPFQKIQPCIRKIFQQNFYLLQQLSINNCDLRTFQNFPYLPKLLDLNVSKNSLQGSFEFLVKNRNLEYLDISGNIIKDITKLEPLRRMKNLKVYAKNNPFYSNFNNKQSSISTKIKAPSLTFLKESKQEKHAQLVKKQEQDREKATAKQLIKKQESGNSSILIRQQSIPQLQRNRSTISLFAESPEQRLLPRRFISDNHYSNRNSYGRNQIKSILLGKQASIFDVSDQEIIFNPTSSIRSFLIKARNQRRNDNNHEQRQRQQIQPNSSDLDSQQDQIQIQQDLSELNDDDLQIDQDQDEDNEELEEDQDDQDNQNGEQF